MSHPYMASSVAALRKEMLAETGAAAVEELFAQVPAGPPAPSPARAPRTARV